MIQRRAGRRAAMVGLATVFMAPLVLHAQTRDWCGDQEDENGFCEVREFSLAARGSLSVDAAPNGGVEVVAWDRNEIRVLAKVSARAGSAAEARALASDISIDTNGTIRASGPRTRGDGGWSVSYRISVPARTDLDLDSTNGGLRVEGVRGTMRLETTNGGIGLSGVAGDVEARTTNGGVDVMLAGSRWDGEGLDAVTRNGGVTVRVPEGYSAHLDVGTTNGGMDLAIPVTVSGRIRRTVSTDLGSGGAPIRVRTTNGGVHVSRSG